MIIDFKLYYHIGPIFGRIYYGKKRALLESFTQETSKLIFDLVGVVSESG